jgi:rhodanese-related sulfurtransferase
MLYRIVLVVVMALARPAVAGHPVPPSVLTMDVAALKELLDHGSRPVSVDLRPLTEYRAGRIPGARSVPLEELRRRWVEVPRDRTVVLYCACPEESVQAAYYFLQRQGFREVFVLKDGFDAWAARGYGVER